MHYFLSGPSGIGKTRFGNWLANRGYDHVLVDPGDGSFRLPRELIDPWQRRDFEGIANELDNRAKAQGKAKGCVLTFRSVDFFPLIDIELYAEHGIAVRYLYGDKEKCFESYAERETRDGRRGNARRDFWERFNNKNYEKIGALELKDYRVDVFNRSGTRRSVEEIAELLRIE
jgi:hypothetical protein